MNSAISVQLSKINTRIASILSTTDAHASLRTDWRAVILSNAEMEPGFFEFVRSLPAESIATIQKITQSIIDNGGEIFLAQGDESDVFLVARNVKTGPTAMAETRINLVLCRCDANFHNCKWFWQKK